MVVNVGDTINTIHGKFEVANVMELINPMTLEKEQCVTVWQNGSERKIRNEDIIDG